MMMRPIDYKHQRGFSILAAVFLFTSLSLLGALLLRLLVFSSEETLLEWYSSQALYAAESGVAWCLHPTNNTAPGNLCLNSALGVNRVVVPDRSWFGVSAVDTVIGPQTMRTITSVGRAGNSVADIRVSRQITVTVMLPPP